MAQSSSRNLQFSGNKNSFNFINNIVNVNTGKEHEKRQILQWLSPLEPQQRHQGVRNERIDGVGSWLLETPEFRKWSDVSTGDDCAQRLLFCYGDPGVGKTYLSSLVIDTLCDQDGSKEIAVAGLYCDFLTEQEQTIINILGAILKQLVNRGEVPEPVRQAFQKAEQEFGGRGLRLPDLVALLKKTIASLRHVFICIDALDESPPTHRLRLLRSLGEILRESPNTRIFLTGRAHVMHEVKEHLAVVVLVSVSPTPGDIVRYLEMRLEGDTEPSAMDDDLRAEIMQVIPETASNIFLLASLNMDAILGEITIHQRRKKLHSITKGKGLGDAYTATIARMKAQQSKRSKLGIDVLMWLSHSERPLHIDELCHALGVEIGSPDLNPDNIPAIKTVLGCSLGLVIVEASSSTVRLIHLTLQEYLLQNPTFFQSPHSKMAEVCLTYLDFQCVRELSPALEAAPAAFPFLQYASCYWGPHARREPTESVIQLAGRLLDCYDEHISCKLQLSQEHWWRWPFNHGQSPTGFTGLHGLALFGIAEIAASLLKIKEWDLNAIDLNGNTALAWAVRKGNEEFVKMLLEREDVKPNIVSREGDTPLFLAAARRTKGIAKLLLRRDDVYPNVTDNNGYTPLLRAAHEGDREVAEMLLARQDIIPDIVDHEGRTPLLWAAINGHEEFAEILLERNDVDPNMADMNDSTPLLWAARNGNEGIVKTLLERDDVNPEMRDHTGKTALLWAAVNGHERVVEMLLGRTDVDLNTTDNKGESALSRAILNGHERVARLLMGRKSFIPNAEDFAETTEPSEREETPS